MKRFMLAFIALMAMIIQPAWAMDKTFTFTVPTTRVGGIALASSEIKNYQLYMVGGASADTLVATVPQPTTSATSVSYKVTNIETLGTGTLSFYVVAVDTNGLVSDPSNKVSVVTGKPTPPTLTVQ